MGNIAILLIFLAVFIIIRNIYSNVEKKKAEEQLSLEAERPAASMILKYARKGFKGIILDVVRNLDIEEKRRQTNLKILRAGLKEEITPDEFFAFKIFMGFVVPLGILVLNTLAEGDLSAPIIAVIGAVLFFYPNLWVNGQITKRQAEIRLSLPFVVDLLTLSTEAGLDFMGALSKVVDRAKPGPLIEELSIMMKEIQLGSSRSDALRNLAYKMDMQEMTSFAAVLITADQMGTSIGAVLRNQSESIRHDRFIRAEKLGSQASQKILFPLIFFILPAVFIMIFGPVIISFVSGGQSI